jgi:glycerol-3-phosphate cytidylyltransferase-like family protein
LETLKQQLERDRIRANDHPHVVMTFGTFDYFHPGHKAYLKEAKQYGDYLITIVARDETVKHIK